MQTLVVHSKDSIDQFGSAFACIKSYSDLVKMDETRFSLPEIHIYKEGDKTHPSVVGKRVIIVGCCYEMSVMEKMIRQAVNTTIVDNKHETWQKFVDYQQPNLNTRIDPRMSASLLSWKFHFGDLAFPWMVRAIEDVTQLKQDWQYSEELYALLESHPLEIKDWDALDKLGENQSSMDKCIVEGKALLRSRTQSINLVANNKYLTEVDEHKVMCCNTSIHCEKVAELISRDMPFGAVWYVAGGKRHWVLKSDGGENVGAIAVKHKGVGSLKTGKWSEDV